MKLRAFLLTTFLIAGLTISEQHASAMRVRTVPKETKDQKDRKKDEPKAATPKQLTTSTAALISPKGTDVNEFAVRNCSQSKSDPCDKLLAQGGVAK